MALNNNKNNPKKENVSSEDIIKNNGNFIVSTLKKTFDTQSYTKSFNKSGDFVGLEMTSDQQRISKVINSLEGKNFNEQKNILIELEKDPYFKMESTSIIDKQIRDNSKKMIASSIEAIHSLNKKELKTAETHMSVMVKASDEVIKDVQNNAKKVDKVATRFNTQEFIMRNVAESLSSKSNNKEMSSDQQRMYNEISELMNKGSDKPKITSQQQKEGLIKLLTDPYLRNTSANQSEELFKQKTQTIAKNALEAFQETEKYNFKAADKKIKIMIDNINNPVVEYYDKNKQNSNKQQNNSTFIETLLEDSINTKRIPNLKPEIAEGIASIKGKDAQAQKDILKNIENIPDLDKNVKKMVSSAIDAIHSNNRKDFAGAEKHLSSIQESRSAIIKQFKAPEKEQNKEQDKAKKFNLTKNLLTVVQKIMRRNKTKFEEEQKNNPNLPKEKQKNTEKKLRDSKRNSTGFSSPG